MLQEAHASIEAIVKSNFEYDRIRLKNSIAATPLLNTGNIVAEQDARWKPRPIPIILSEGIVVLPRLHPLSLSLMTLRS